MFGAFAQSQNLHEVCELRALRQEKGPRIGGPWRHSERP
jgi:hypothetical protein